MLKELCAPYWVQAEMLQQACTQHLGSSNGSKGATADQEQSLGHSLPSCGIRLCCTTHPR